MEIVQRSRIAPILRGFMTEKKPKKNEPSIDELYPKMSFRVPKDLKEMVDLACEETGLTQSNLVRMCIKEGLPYVIGLRAERGAKLSKELAAGLHDPKAPSSMLGVAEYESHQTEGEQPSRPQSGPKRNR